MNSFILCRYSPCNLPISSYLKYRSQLAAELIGNYNSRKHHVISSTIIHHHLVLNTPHFPCKAPTKGRCKLHPCKSQTTWYCRTILLPYGGPHYRLFSHSPCKQQPLLIIVCPLCSLCTSCFICVFSVLFVFPLCYLCVLFVMCVM